MGLYTSTNRITEALSDGVVTRGTGNQKEYPFRVYKVMKADKSGRYALTNRKAVSKLALSFLGRPYDYNFADNKNYTTAGNKKFNCSELVWKSWKFNGNVSPDLDSNGGVGVYPNDIRDSSRTVKISEG